MAIHIRQQVKSIMWQSIGRVTLINASEQRVYVEFEDSSRHNGWYDIGELVVLVNTSPNSEPTIVFSND